VVSAWATWTSRPSPSTRLGKGEEAFGLLLANCEFAGEEFAG
jgi:hypothetical protein